MSSSIVMIWKFWLSGSYTLGIRASVPKPNRPCLHWLWGFEAQERRLWRELFQTAIRFWMDVLTFSLDIHNNKHQNRRYATSGYGSQRANERARFKIKTAFFDDILRHPLQLSWSMQTWSSSILTPNSWWVVEMCFAEHMQRSSESLTWFFVV